MITFKKIKWKNINSTGNTFIEVDLDQNKSTLFLGTNGAGKSTILDALTFGLFGVPFRNVNKGTIVNSTNQRNAVVEVEFSIQDKDYKIIRGIKPNIFEIWVDGLLIDQNSKTKDYQKDFEKYILKMNYKSFTQIVILGSATFKPFMQLPAGDRRAIIEDLLDIEIFSLMNGIAKQKLADTKTKIAEISVALKGIESKRELVQNTLAKLQEQDSDRREELIAEIDMAEGYINKHNHELQILNDLIKEKQEAMPDLTKLEQRYSKLASLRTQIETNRDKHKDHIDFYQDHDDCPTCKQKITEVFKSQMIVASETHIRQFDSGIRKLDAEIDAIRSEMREINTDKDRIRQYENSARSHLQEIAHNQNLIEKNRKILKTVHNDLITENQALLDQFELEEIDLKSQFNELSTSKEYYEVAVQLLKDDGIKTKIIKQYLPVINKQINTYLLNMGFAINFEIDESFKETIKSQYRSDFTYNNFSEGEKLRIDLAILFTWRVIAKLKNSISTNLLILDEILDRSLDANGIDDTMKLIELLSKDANVIVISPKGEMMANRFEKTIKFVRNRGYAEIHIE